MPACSTSTGCSPDGHRPRRGVEGRCSTTFLRGVRVSRRPFDEQRLRRVRRRQAALRRRALVPASRGIELPRSGDASQTVRPRNRKNELVLELMRRARGQGLRRVQALPRRRRARPACDRRRVLEPQLPRDPRRRRHRRSASSASSTATSPRTAASRASRRRTRSCAAAQDLGVEPAAAAVFEDALAGVEAGRAGHFGCVVGVDRVGQAEALRDHGADVVVEDLAELLDRRDRAPSSRSSRGRCARPRSTSTCSPQSESIFALANGHIGLRGEPRRGRAVRAPRDVPQRLLRVRPLPYGEARLRLPRVGPDHRQRHRREDHAAARRRRAVRHPLRRAAAATSACSTCAPGVLSAMSTGSRPPAPASGVRSTRLVSFEQRGGRGDRVRGRAARPAGARRRAVRAGGQRAGAAALRDPRAAAELESPLESEESPTTTAAVVLVHATRRSGLRMAAAWTTSSRRPARSTRSPRARGGPRPRHDRHRHPRAGAAAARWSSSSPTTGRSQRSQSGVRDQVDAASPRRAHRAGTGSCAPARSTSTTSGTGADVEIEGDPEIQQAVRFALFQLLQAGARAERRAIAGQGPDRDAATTATRSGTPRRSCCPSLTYTAPETVADALRWRHSTLDLARERADAARPRRRGVPVAHDPRRGVLGLLARRARPRSTSTRTIADAVRRYLDASGDEAFEREIGLELLVETARLWRVARAPRRPTAASASTASPAPTSTARSPTTTSTRTCMAQKNLRAAADAVARHPRRAARARGRPGGDRRPGATRRATIVVPYDDKLGVHPQSEGFTDHEPWDFEADGRPTTRCFCTSRTSISTASRSSSRPTSCWRCHSAATPSRDEQKARDFDYYEAITVRDSSLSACIAGGRRRRGRAPRARLRLLRPRPR